MIIKPVCVRSKIFVYNSRGKGGWEEKTWRTEFPKKENNILDLYPYLYTSCTLVFICKANLHEKQNLDKENKIGPLVNME